MQYFIVDQRNKLTSAMPQKSTFLKALLRYKSNNHKCFYINIRYWTWISQFPCFSNNGFMISFLLGKMRKYLG